MSIDGLRSSVCVCVCTVPLHTHSHHKSLYEHVTAGYVGVTYKWAGETVMWKFSEPFVSVICECWKRCCTVNKQQYDLVEKEEN